MLDDDPRTGEGCEPAIAYALAEQLGYAKSEVEWARADFNAAIAPGPKAFDVDVNQFSIDPQRAKAVEFSSPCYDVVQSVVTTAGKAATATSIEDLKGLRFGSQVGTTSLTSLTDQIDPTDGPSVHNSDDHAVAALKNDHVDAIVADLPTAFFMSGAQLEEGALAELQEEWLDQAASAPVLK